MKVAINGFGRIGRAAAKIILEKNNLELVAVNDLSDIGTLAHLLKYDSCYGIYSREIKTDKDSLLVNNRRIKFLSEKDPRNLPWKKLGVDVVIESTGAFLSKERSRTHLQAGAKRVILSAPAKDDDIPTYIVGVNSDKYSGEKIVSNASCTTNCVTPIMDVLEKKIGIQKALMTTVHSYTADQNLVDGPHKDLRRARSGAYNIVPTTTGAARTTAKVIPKLRNKFDGLSIRVPTPVVSISDVVALTRRDTTVLEINGALLQASEGSHWGIITASNQPLVSTDLIGDSSSAIVDLQLTQVVDGNLIKVVAWYDNEWGYSNRLVELAEIVGK
ncbi:MAG: type I glyceraldehyde-3-phosphate dehydrogenase [Patescibacteria group bacterium]|jgi:glyceraldehyde 3-phosphate dehydrogenase